MTFLGYLSLGFALLLCGIVVFLVICDIPTVWGGKGYWQEKSSEEDGHDFEVDSELYDEFWNRDDD
jgi:hypothetical protein